ncbi:MAG: OmpH family outer membrane protein [Flavobacteriales bacterium]|nr:OmpH family outer membrane protein [Flavobacteriales bacterium]
MKKILLSFLAICFSLMVFSQKFGHCDGQEILSLMPEMKTVQAQLQTQADQLKAHLTTEETELNKLIAEYETQNNTWPEAIEQSKRQAIVNKQQEMGAFEQSANDEISQLQQKLLDPLLKQATDAIEAVGKENAFTYIFDASTGLLLYRGGVDVTPMVKAKLGIQ